MVLLHDPHDLVQDSPFEFFTAESDMCAADDVILGGELLPFGAPPPARPEKAQAHNPPNFLDRDHRRSSSLGEPPRGCWGGKLAGGGDYRRLRKVPDSDHKEAAVAPDMLKPRPRWYVLVFGSVRVPGAMELRDIRIRQRRRSPLPSPPEAAKDSGERGPWKLLRSLSCKGMEAVIVS